MSRFPIHNNDIYKIFMSDKHLIQANFPVLVTFNFANTACKSLNAYLDHVLSNDITIAFDHDSLTGPNFEGLNSSEQCQKVVNSILANSPNPTNTSFIASYL